MLTKTASVDHSHCCQRLVDPIFAMHNTDFFVAAKVLSMKEYVAARIAGHDLWRMPKHDPLEIA